MIYIRFILTLSIAAAWMSLKAQISDARQEMQLFNYSGALVLLEKAVKTGNAGKQVEAYRLLSECCRKQNKIAEAACWDSLLVFSGKAEPADYLNYALSLKSCGKYPEARKYLLLFDSLAPGNPSVKTQAAGCDSAVIWQKREPGLKVYSLPDLNSPASDFSPVWYGNELLFASDRYDTSGKTDFYGWTGNPYLSMYQTRSVRGDSIPRFIPPVPFLELVTGQYHSGPVCFNSSFSEAFINCTFLRGDKGKKEDGKIRTHLLKIFHSKKTGGKWSLPEPFFLNSEEYSVGHPALSPDGNTLFFVSDMKEGFGGTDIWCCSRKGEHWDKPVNAGPLINSPGNEMFPYMDHNGDLYFASDGHPGMGGLDLFICRKQGNSWLHPENPGPPLNSSWDDFALIKCNFDPLSSAATIPDSASRLQGCGFFSSNRPGGKGNDDIWFFRSISVEQKTIPPPALASKEELPEKFIPEVGKTYRIDNIYYDFDKWNIRKDARPPLDSLVRILNEYPVNIEISSHTDCRGSVAYNQILSQKRAESVVRYLIEHGIDSRRLSAMGYGKSRLINHCNCESGIQCSETEHQANRRTEFTVLSITP